MSSESLQTLVIVGISILFLAFHLWPRLVAVFKRVRRRKYLLDPVPYERLAVDIFEFVEQRREQDLDDGVHPLAGVSEGAEPRLKKALLDAHRERVAAYSAETVDLFNQRFGVRVEYLYGLARAAGYLHERDDGASPSRPADLSEILDVVQTLKFIAQMIGQVPRLVSQRAD
jgi:hypothetical protein